MIKENQELLNRINVISDGVLSCLMLPLAYWIRFYVMSNGVQGIPFQNYIRLGVVFAVIQIFTCAAFGLYQVSRKTQIRDEMSILLKAGLINMMLLLGWLFIGHGEHYSRLTLAMFFAFSTAALMIKHAVLRKALRAARKRGKNLKHILLIGSGSSAQRYMRELKKDLELGYQIIGYVARHPMKGEEVPYLGGYEALHNVLERYDLDDVVSAIDMQDYQYTAQIIDDCEQAGVKLAIVPAFADYMPGRPQFDELNGIPLINIRRIPLDNFVNAFLKRASDIIGSLVLIVILAPVMLICAVGVKMSSPGPILFKQERIGKNRQPFNMYKFRSMRVNDTQDNAWSTTVDARRTRFGSILRKYSMDELPQLFCVLAGTMSLVGPRPEIPYFTDRFKNEVPLYMVRHQVRPGITGWAQIHGFRGDTPIKERVEHD